MSLFITHSCSKATAVFLKHKNEYVRFARFLWYLASASMTFFMFWKFDISRLNTFGATHAWSWVGVTLKIKVSPCPTVRVKHNMAICNNVTLSLSLCGQLCKQQHVDYFWDHMVNLCLSNVTPKSGYSFCSPPLRYACDPCQHTPRTGSTDDHQSVSFGSRFCNLVLNFNKIWHRLSSPVRLKVWLISR